MIQKAVSDFLFGLAFGIGFALSSWVASLLIQALSHAVR